MAAWQRKGGKKNDRSVFEEERMTARLDEEVGVSYFCTYILFYIYNNKQIKNFCTYVLLGKFSII